MSVDTRVALLTPYRNGAIATVALAGPRAWEYARRLFRPVGGPLPLAPALHRFWFGVLGEGVGDEVILAATTVEPEVTVEVHCHGGVRIAGWVVEQFLGLGCVLASGEIYPNDPWQLLLRAPTLRTAAILLDQAQGAFAAAVQRVRHLLRDNPAAAMESLRELAAYAPVGRRLVQPWRVVVAGPPNVGKSSLVNALAGYQRAIVSGTAGTTRDVVTASLAFDGWPVELTDTAGLRDAAGLEAEGIERARRVLQSADAIVWVLDASERELAFPGAETAASAGLPANQWIFAMNKCDRAARRPGAPPGAIAVSALTGAGIPELIAAIVSRLAPTPPPPGAAVPFTPRLADVIADAFRALECGQIEETSKVLDGVQLPDPTSNGHPPPYP